jgi:hypothetical protein
MDYIYVDNSNLYIEGRRVSAVANGLAESIVDAMNDGIFDHGYTMSFGKLHEFLTGNDLTKIKRVALFGSRPPPNDSIWRHAKAAGFELHMEDRNYVNNEPVLRLLEQKMNQGRLGRSLKRVSPTKFC